MNLDLTDPESIVCWWRCFPERHWLQLGFFEEARPQFRAAIRDAQRRIEADPLFNQHRIQAFADVMGASSMLGDEGVAEVAGISSLH